MTVDRRRPDAPPLAIGIIGGGRHAAALADHQAPLPHVTVARWSAGPGREDLAPARELANRIGAPWAREWRDVARDPSIGAVLVLSDAAAPAASEAALQAGKIVFCAAPAATRADEANRLAAAQAGGRGVLLTGGAFRHSAAGREALRLIAGAELGTLHSMFVSVRLPMAVDQTAVLEEAGWNVFDFLAAAVASPVARVHANAAVLFGPGTSETAVCIVRFESDLIATIEVARCLPPSIPADAEGDVEIEVIGARQALRLQPNAAAVRVYGSGPALRPWVDAPVLSMLRELMDVAEGRAPGGDGVAETRRAVALMDGVRAAAARPIGT